MPKIHILVERESWICHRLANYLAAIPGFTVSIGKESRPADITYYLPYLLAEFHKSFGLSVGLFTHWDTHQSKLRYETLAKKMDSCLVISKPYEKFLTELLSKEKVLRIPMPLEPYFFRSQQLIVGWFHRSPVGYGTRKRVDLLQKVSSLPWVKIVRTNGKEEYKTVSTLIRQCDVVLITSDYEAGPSSALEGLAAGKYVVMAKGVGLADELAESTSFVKTFEPGNEQSLISVLGDVRESIFGPVKAVAINTVENWRSMHKKHFEALLNASPNGP